MLPMDRGSGPSESGEAASELQTSVRVSEPPPALSQLVGPPATGRTTQAKGLLPHWGHRSGRPPDGWFGRCPGQGAACRAAFPGGPVSDFFPPQPAPERGATVHEGGPGLSVRVFRPKGGAPDLHWGSRPLLGVQTPLVVGSWAAAAPTDSWCWEQGELPGHGVSLAGARPSQQQEERAGDACWGLAGGGIRTDLPALGAATLGPHRCQTPWACPASPAASLVQQGSRPLCSGALTVTPARLAGPSLKQQAAVCVHAGRSGGGGCGVFPRAVLWGGDGAKLGECGPR